MTAFDFLTNDTRVSTALGTTLSRRSMMKSLAGASAAALAVATIGRADAHHTEQTYTVSANANFRSGPGTGYSILGVISKGATFNINGQVQNGYAGVIYGGKTGWVLASLVVQAGAPSAPAITGVGVTIASVNLRSGPGSSYSILRVVPSASQVGTSTTVTSGYRYVTHNGLAGWIADAYIAMGPGSGPVPSYQTTTANVNLRAEPSTSAPVLLVIPSGSKVVPTGSAAYNFGQVTYNGVKGWVSMAYLV